MRSRAPIEPLAVDHKEDEVASPRLADLLPQVGVVNCRCLAFLLLASAQVWRSGAQRGVNGNVAHAAGWLSAGYVVASGASQRAAAPAGTGWQQVLPQRAFERPDGERLADTRLLVLRGKSLGARF